ncbi:porin family protein [Verrucomicrobia bacterium S94]|nr:porin family protein [Verrucomicrobia bacterium S94]
MMKITRIIPCAVLALAVAVQVADAETLLGKNYIGGSFGIIQFGNDFLDDVFGTGKGVQGSGNIVLHEHVDLNLTGGYLWADGDFLGLDADVSVFSGGAYLVYHFLPGEKINPFLNVGAGAVRTEIEVAGFEEHETDASFDVGGGVEIEATEAVLFRGSVDYTTIDNDDDVTLSATLGYWFTEQLLGGAGFSYTIDGEDITGDISLTFTM